MKISTPVYLEKHTSHDNFNRMFLWMSNVSSFWFISLVCSVTIQRVICMYYYTNNIFIEEYVTIFYLFFEINYTTVIYKNSNCLIILQYNITGLLIKGTKVIELAIHLIGIHY